VAGAPFHRQQDRPAPLSAHSDALQQAQHREQQRCGKADRGESGKHPDQGGADAHDQQGGDEGGLAADPVAVVTEDGGTDRPGGEPDELGAERSDDARVLALPGKEDLREDQGGCGAVEEEVVPLDRRADRTGRRESSNIATAELNEHDILAVDGRIVEVGTDVRAPVGAEVIDARGLVVMPGLIDAHVHVTAATADLSAISTWPVSYVTAQDGAVVLDRR
jgi:hypothetical protein